MNTPFPTGVWPVMLTPFTVDNQIDFVALEKLVNWYIDAGVSGLFAVCQSSEMFFLSLEERVALSSAVVKCTAGRVPVISSGQLSTNLEEQIKEVNAIAATGADAVILLSNQFASPEESDDIWWDNLSLLLNRIDPAIKLGFYECPYPYKRVISPALLQRCANTKRFFIMKDTCCDENLIEEKLAAIYGTNLSLFNANTATLLDSLRKGCCGYSGIMANFHPDLYVWLCKFFQKYPRQAEILQGILTMCSYIEKQLYPVNAKYALSLRGLMGIETRSKNASDFNRTMESEVQQLVQLSACLSQQIVSLN